MLFWSKLHSRAMHVTIEVLFLINYFSIKLPLVFVNLINYSKSDTYVKSFFKKKTNIIGLQDC
jgi:hypothetical protein